MKKTTSKNLSKKLAKYGALTVAIAGVSEATGQIIYTDIADTVVDDALFSFDLDGDMVNDFTVLNTGAINVAIPGSTYPGAYNGNGIIGSSSYGGNYLYPFALSSGNNISAGGTMWNTQSDFQTMNWNSCNYVNSNWCGGIVDGYLGLQFDIGGNTHYGWVRIDMPADGTTMTVKDFAYNSTAGASILAGQQTLSIAEQSLNDIRVIGLNKSIGLYNLPEQVNFNIYDVTGKSVLQGDVHQRDYVIEAGSLSNGIYIVEVINPNTNATVRKKVVL